MYYQQGIKYKRPTKYINGKQKLISRLVMENYIKRKLKSFELVHHKDGNPFNNTITNLLLTDRSNHKKLHNEIGEETRIKQKWFFEKDKIIKLYLKHKRVIILAEIYGCQEMTIERVLRKFLNCKSLRIFAKERRWKYVKR